MDRDRAFELLELYCDAGSDPVLDAAEVDSILAAAVRTDAAGNAPANLVSVGAWSASTRYATGDVITASPPDGRYWSCLIAGVSDPVQPEWPDLSGEPRTFVTVSDDEVTWADSGTTWTPTWDLNAAAATAWTVKAGKAAARFAFTTDGQVFARQQIAAACRAQAAMYRRKVAKASPTV